MRTIKKKSTIKPKTKSKRKIRKKPALKKQVKSIPPALMKARSLRSSLLRRIHPDLKYTTPETNVLFNWLNREHYACYYCLIDLEINFTTIDHKQPLNRGGENGLDNLCICCKNCNTAKGNFTEEEFRTLLQLINTWEVESKETLLKRLRQGNYIFGK